ncbi:MAG: hypothetical protein PHO32_07420 [Candidatus Cloacimonetes bacterium]|nr:hypothetical protein [Candidatus Cloacimonadota bacterium]
MTKHVIGLLTLATCMLLLTSCFVSSSLMFTEKDVDGSLNLVVNSHFEAMSGTASEALYGWAVTLDPGTGGTSPVIVDGTESYEGDGSIRIKASANSVLILSDAFKVRRYGGYYLRANLKSDSPQAPQVQMRFIVFKDDGTITNKFADKTTATAEWNRTTISAGFIRPGAKFGRLGIYIPPFSEGSVWIDNAGCYEVHGFKID